MVWLLRMLAILQRIQVQFPPTSVASQSLVIPVPGGPVASFWPPQALHSFAIHTSTHTHNLKQIDL